VNCSTGTVIVSTVATGRRTVLPLPDGSPERLTGGYKNELLRYGDVVLRLEKTTLESARWEHRLLRTLAPQLPEVVAPIAGPTLWDDGRVASLWPFVAGGDLDRDDPRQRRDLADTLARLHRAGLGPECGQRPGAASWDERDLVRNAWWDWELVEKPGVLVDAYDELVAYLADPPDLVAAVVHGDVYRGNVRVLRGLIVGLVDWEDARIDWPAWELANATWEVCRIGDALDDRRAHDFVEAYVSAGGPGETEPFAAMLRFRLVADLLYSLTSKARGEAFDQDYVDHLLRALA
jgi:Ser/Thr protein kinase RdoA (MazF antagonist)